MKKKLLIVLFMFISFTLGVVTVSYLVPALNKPLLCKQRLLNLEEKNIILSEHQQIENPFFKNWYGDLDILKTKNIYIKNNLNENIDLSCFNKEIINPWRNLIYLESEGGDIHEIMCRK